MASSNVWADFETLRHNVKLNTVDRLKQILTGFNDDCQSNLTKSGKKQELIDRITREMDSWRRTNNTERWTKGKAILNQVRLTGQYSPSRMGSENAYQTTSTPHTTYNAATSSAESTSAMDRRQQSLNFTLPTDVHTKLNSPRSIFTHFLFILAHCVFSPKNPTTPCLIEFPPTCEVRVNSVPLTANLKGMKKTWHSATPDLGKSVRIAGGLQIGQQPVQPKKFYLVVMLVETTSVEQLVDRLKKGKYRSSQDIRAKSASADDDILSYMRITTPCRSISCVHSQCFDAFSWYSVMEQTTTWLCPVCEKAYFDGILSETPEDVEDVIVEADGEWHSSDNKYGSVAWKENHPPPKQPSPLKLEPTIKQRSRSPVKPVPVAVVSSEKKKSLPRNAEISEEELSPSNEGHASFSANGSFSNASQPPRSQTQDDVIDLTLSSDDEGPPPAKKRKTTDSDFPSPTEPIWKKSRYDGGASSPGSSSSSGAAYTNGRYSRPITGTPTSSSSSVPRYAYPVYPPAPPRTNGNHGQYHISEGMSGLVLVV
ncbi:hypothetical protein B0H21DRAFT_723283 [Amylocystis lapponica]|nr:hypothetical protein B0H21DRAFT_723283 [Amylocystis lapponica]